MLSINNNILAMNAANRLNTNVDKKVKSAEKLSSGYRINRSADDAAGLSISEKMRMQIRGLNQGTQNATDGVSWCQIGDGALEEAQAMLHRMSELAIKSMNGTNSDSDRMDMEREFEQLQSEFDRIGRTTKFNGINIFEEHELPYYQCEGCVQWDPQELHEVIEGKNQMIYRWRNSEDSPVTESVITVAPGTYTTQELIDELETLGGVRLEFTPDGYVNANLENGKMIESVSGDLSYLLYEMYSGGSFGALIGTTIFSGGPLEIKAGQNDTMTFDVESFEDGSTKHLEVKIAEGFYTREKMIDEINAQMADQNSTVKATPYGSGIKLADENGIVTGFKGNMFKIDVAPSPIYDSVFYDNVKFGNVTKTSAYFQGGPVLTSYAIDKEHQEFEITSANNQLTLQTENEASPVTLTIDEGRYSIDDMVTELQGLFDNNGLELKADKCSHYYYDSGTGNYSVTYYGLKITSKTEGLPSKLTVDSGSSAYNTLFVNRTYNTYGSAATFNEISADEEGILYGAKIINGLSASSPLVIDNNNNTFQISITTNDGTNSANVTIANGTYTSGADLVAALNAAFNDSGADAAYKGKVQASVCSNHYSPYSSSYGGYYDYWGGIKLTGVVGEGVNQIGVSAAGTNTGYKDLFVQSKTTATTASGAGVITCNTVYDGNVDASETNFRITVDGQSYTITLPQGTQSKAQILDIINNQQKIEEKELPNKFNNVNASGGTKSFGYTYTGGENSRSWSDAVTGTTVKTQGSTGFQTNTPAKVTLGGASYGTLDDSSLRINSGNNKFKLAINGNTQTITLAAKIYDSQEALRKELQDQIDHTFGTGLGGAVVSIEGGKLVLTARLPDPTTQRGDQTSISTSTSWSDNTFLNDLCASKSAAVWRSSNSYGSTSYTLADTIEIGDDNRDFIFTYRENNVDSTVKLTLDKGSYDRNTIISQLNTQLAKTGTGVTASKSGNLLYLTSTAKGNDVSISYSTTTSGNTSARAVFGLDYAASDVLTSEMNESIKIEAGVNDIFSLTVNGIPVSVTLGPGTYSRSTLVSELNNKLSGKGVEAYLSGTKLGLRTTAKGPSAKLAMTYDTGGTSMKPIFGKIQSAITASFDGSGKLVLSASQGNKSTISVSSDSGGPFQKGTVTTGATPNYDTGYHSTQHSYVDGASLSGDVIIDEWSDELNFYFFNGSLGWKEYKFKVDHDTYNYADLQTKLQDMLDDNSELKDKIKVTVNANGVRFEAVNSGSSYRFCQYAYYSYQNTNSFSGDFYDKIMRGGTEKTVSMSTSHADGTQGVDPVYTIGRQDVVSKPVTIRRGISDELTFDLTYGGQVIPLTMTLDAGDYQGESLKNMVQEKVNKALTDANLPENLIEVGIGGIDSGVAGSNDANALNFRLSQTVEAPDTGEFIIDGVRGNAAFEIFYQTDGPMVPAYIKGVRDVSDGVDLGEDETTLGIDVDGKTYNFTLAAGHYTADELLDALNDAFDAEGVPIAAELEGGRVKISHQKMGEHRIQGVSGTARDDIFFNEHGAEGPADERAVRLSGESNDKIELKRQVFSTMSLGINSLCISKAKNAAKAVNRLDIARQKISAIRSEFGSTQNHLEHAIRNNENKAENTQAAESLIRDTDMAEEMMRFSNHSILEQAGQAILAQANQSSNAVLQLLQS